MMHQLLKSLRARPVIPCLYAVTRPLTLAKLHARVGRPIGYPVPDGGPGTPHIEMTFRFADAEALLFGSMLDSRTIGWVQIAIRR